ncbi:hypothetical protein CCAX7_51980 [Capsulimonas corticalis]|uniref:Uncharacterized protein n=2 Tax=Capsulimonas corticalis TaxID=2219043 RepID=A0A402CP70_9BACT|nr:hypothetical protein CCAX7_51980 [Capsulimonas corticalis]
MLYAGGALAFFTLPAHGANGKRGETNILPQATLAASHFGHDAPWYKENIPFFECSDPQITEIYYYRWKDYKSHLRDLGARGYIATEFLDDVGWSLKPYESLNDATAFHIHEGRWLRDRRYMDDYIDFMYHGGNDRHFSESIADAAYSRYLVDSDRAFAVKNLEEMKRIYQQWDDHWDAGKGLYFIEPLLDATEYTISSIDASGGRDGFVGGDAFRPSINSFMFANARAISRLSALAGDAATAQEYASKADTLRSLMERDLWNDDFQHYIDRYKVSNQFVHYWDFIRGRELAGYTPWYFDLPDRDPKYAASWRHILDPARLGGPGGIRTVEPSYEYYMRQYRYAHEDGKDKPECQWNGPSWPFQTTLALGGLANFLNDYPKQAIIGDDDYVRLLRQYTQQHYRDGKPDLQEDYDPNTGRAIVGLNRSHHYNHSGYNDLVITGLAGLRPRADDILEINPLLRTGSKSKNPIASLCLENASYHGRLVTILYDRDGKHYHRGVGLSVWVDGRLLAKSPALGRILVKLPKQAAPPRPSTPSLANLAVNLTRSGFPAPSASLNSAPADLYPAVDGRVWFYPELRNYWTNLGSRSQSDWFSLDLGSVKTVQSARLYFYGDGAKFKAPASAAIQYWTGNKWADAPGGKTSALKPVENGETVIRFAPVQTSRLRVLFANPESAAVALVEMKVYGTQLVASPERTATAQVTGLPLELEGLQQENSRTGEFNGKRWRDANDGGYFAFDLKTAPNAPNALVVTYWGGDAGNRRFDILVNGVHLAEQTLENNQPGQFFDVSYPIPTDLTQGKSTITVRFQAKPGATAGGVFGAQLAPR